MSTDTDEPTAAAAPSRRPWWWQAMRVLALLVVASVIVAVLKDKMPSPREFWAALIRGHWWWVAAAFVLQIASIGMLIRQQRRLLRAFGVPLTFSRVGAITYSSTALSMSMPAGGAVGAGYSYRQYRANGASSATATTVLLISGVLSAIGLVVLYLAGLGLAGGSSLLQLGQNNPWQVLMFGAAVVAVILLGTAWLSRTSPAGRGADAALGATPSPRLDLYSARHPRLGAAVRQLLHTGRRASRVHRHDWRLALFTSAANWALDAASLYASCRAFDVRIGMVQLGAIYLGIQLVRQIPLTPGGVGVIEASLLAALVAAHAAEAPASAAVLIYRLFAAWLIVPIGFLMLALIRRRTPPSESESNDLDTRAAPEPAAG